MYYIVIYHPLPSTSMDCACYSCKSVYNLCQKASQNGSFLTLLWGRRMDDHDDVARIGGIAECCRIPFDLFLDPRCTSFRQTAENQINRFTQNVSTRWLLVNLAGVFLGTENQWFSLAGNRNRSLHFSP